MERWVEEKLHQSWNVRLKADDILYEVQSDLQKIIIFENKDFGRVLMLDDIVQLSSKDEFIYHEMVAHMALFAYDKAKQVLIIGGGDGGVLREVLRHKNIERVVLCEIDEAVIKLAKDYFPFVSSGAFDDQRAEIIIKDGFQYVQENQDQFDVILVDSTDPIGPAKILFSKDFYASCHKALKPGGLLVRQSGLPFLQADELQTATSYLDEVGFDDVSSFWAEIPSYFGGPMAFSWASKDENYRILDRSMLEKRFEDKGFETSYYTPAVHQGAFALPPYIARLVKLPINDH